MLRRLMEAQLQRCSRNFMSGHIELISLSSEAVAASPWNATANNTTGLEKLQEDVERQAILERLRLEVRSDSRQPLFPRRRPCFETDVWTFNRAEYHTRTRTSIEVLD